MNEVCATPRGALATDSSGGGGSGGSGGGLGGGPSMHAGPSNAPELRVRTNEVRCPEGHECGLQPLVLFSANTAVQTFCHQCLRRSKAKGAIGSNGSNGSKRTNGEERGASQLDGASLLGEGGDGGGEDGGGRIDGDDVDGGSGDGGGGSGGGGGGGNGGGVLPPGMTMYTCRSCGFDLCAECHAGVAEARAPDSVVFKQGAEVSEHLI